MSTWVYPPIPPDELRKAEEESLKLELQWLLQALQHSLVALKEGLEECDALLAPKEPGSTLVLSSLRSENVKGFVTRIGTKLVKGDIHLRLTTLPPNTPRGTTTSTPSTRHLFHSSSTSSEILLPQLSTVKALINDSLDVIDVSRWTGQSTDSSFMTGQLKLLHDHLREAKTCLKGPVNGTDLDSIPGAQWWLHSSDENIFQPPLGDYLSMHFTIQDANLVLTVRTLAPASPGGTPSTPLDSAFSLSGFSLRSKLLGLGPRPPTHDEIGEVFEWHGKQDVIVREKVRVESSDPSLLSLAAKLSALEHEVARWRLNLRIILTGNVEED
ncbi:hypothetical protein A1O1_09083 [Capronia coronata CBS 617.96]|uniref:RAVE subunit 2/Rogdi n=1 Tax=Capronia coronata CBS 617.96 TaxID=1182541 RepID=W9XNY6_9EURO|nr:uncharacterized protein A1O1_09083 [Capronia coronata CBS 617.96]EXJ78681.1 hypothetical protein A1O1_09083 [Capronia coronata CBS 617.96]